MFSSSVACITIFIVPDIVCKGIRKDTTFLPKGCGAVSQSSVQLGWGSALLRL
jgi:hypothetical protein